MASGNPGKSRGTPGGLLQLRPLLGGLGRVPAPCVREEPPFYENLHIPPGHGARSPSARSRAAGPSTPSDRRGPSLLRPPHPCPGRVRFRIQDSDPNGVSDSGGPVLSCRSLGHDAAPGCLAHFRPVSGAAKRAACGEARTTWHFRLRRSPGGRADVPTQGLGGASPRAGRLGGVRVHAAPGLA